MMVEIADLLLAAGALGAGFYCFVLSRRLRRFNDLEKGVGGAVALLSAQVDDLTRALAAARDGARDTRVRLNEQVTKAESVATRLELMIASMHDFAAPEPRRSETSTARPPDPSGAAQFMRHPANHEAER